MTAKHHPNGRFVAGTHWRRRKPHWDKAWLEKEYVTNLRSSADIAAEVGCKENNIHFWLAKHSIPRRSTSEVRSIKHWGIVGPANPMYGKRGPLCRTYIDGSSHERQTLLSRSEGRQFTRSVLARDNFKCVRCGAINTGKRSLHAHHLKPWAGNKELRFDLSNAVILCRKCHLWVHSKANAAREYLP